MGIKIGKYIDSYLKIHNKKHSIWWIYYFYWRRHFLDKTEQHHLVTKILLFGDVILISDAELNSKEY